MQIPGSLLPERLVRWVPRICILPPLSWFQSSYSRPHWELESCCMGTVPSEHRRNSRHCDPADLSSRPKHWLARCPWVVPLTPLDSSAYVNTPVLCGEDRRGRISERKPSAKDSNILSQLRHLPEAQFTSFILLIIQMFTVCLPWARLLAGALPLASPLSPRGFQDCKWTFKGQLFLSVLPPFGMQDSPLMLKLAPLHGEGPSWPSGRVLASTMSFTREALLLREGGSACLEVPRWQAA